MRTRSQRRPIPDVSVVVPVYNQELHLAAGIESVLEQRDVSLEVICVEDRSTDASWSILKRLHRADRRVQLVRHPTNRGEGPSRNTGIERARGRYIQNADPDDLLPPDALASLSSAAAETGAEVVRGLAERLDGDVRRPWNGEVAGEVRPEAASVPELQGFTETRVGSLLDLPELWIPWFHVCHLTSSELLRRRGIRFPSLSVGADLVFLVEVLTAASKLCVLPKTTYTYRVWHHSRPGFESVSDYLTSTVRVKEIYGSRFSPCWAAYEPFVKFDLAKYIESAALDEDQRRRATARLAKISSNDRRASAELHS